MGGRNFLAPQHLCCTCSVGLAEGQASPHRSRLGSRVSCLPPVLSRRGTALCMHAVPFLNRGFVWKKPLFFSRYFTFRPFAQLPASGFFTPSGGAGPGKNLSGFGGRSGFFCPFPTQNRFYRASNRAQETSSRPQLLLFLRAVFHLPKPSGPQIQLWALGLFGGPF